MNLTEYLAGMAPALMLVSAALTAMASAFLLWLYRRAVVRSMAKDSSSSLPPPVPSSVQAPSRASRPLATRLVRAADPAPGGEVTYRQTTRSLRQLGMVYGLGGLAYAVILSIPWMVASGSGFLLQRFLWLVACYAWPTVLALGLASSTTRRSQLAITAIYFASLLALSLTVLLGSPSLNLGQLTFFWLFVNAPATLLLWAFLHQRVRAVGPLVLVFMVTGVAGALLIPMVADGSPALLRAVVEIGLALELGATSLFVLLHLVGFGILGALGWRILAWLGRLYRQKRMSDQSLTLDALFLVFGVVQSMNLTFEGWAWIFTGLVAFAVYKLVTRAAFRKVAARASRNPEESSTLLLLRVFALGPRSARLFHSLSQRWLRIGSISLIAGPDLATTTIEPYEFLNFVGGRLSRQFLESQADLEQRLVERDAKPDPDGRYRVNEFFCRRDSWQLTMRRLAAQSEAVLMDLRSFSRSNQACLYEVEQLVHSVQLGRALLLVDQTTDQAYLEEQLHEVWRRLPQDSPNRGLHSPEVTLFLASRDSSSEAQALVKALFERKSCQAASAGLARLGFALTGP